MGFQDPLNTIVVGCNKIVLFSNKYYWMNIVNRNRVTRAIHKQPSYDFTSIPKQPSHLRRDSMPITSIAAMHYAKRQTCPNINLHHDLPQPYPIHDQSTIAHISTNGIYDSRKDKHQNMAKLDWKILTLKQIKGKEPTQIQNIQQSIPRGNRKIFVSISKSNRSASKQKQSVVESRRSAAEPRLSELGKGSALRSMSNNRRIVDMVELQMQEIRTNRFFC